MKITPAVFGLLTFVATIEAIPSSSLSPQPGSAASIKNLKDKIKNIYNFTTSHSLFGVPIYYMTMCISHRVLHLRLCSYIFTRGMGVEFQV